MVQARKRSKARKKKSSGGSTFRCLSMLLAGVVIGALATTLWQGTKSSDHGIGSGIRDMIETSRLAEQQQQESVSEDDAVLPQAQQKTSYDFFTVLPEIEVVVSEQDEVKKPAPKISKENSADKKAEKTVKSSVYMLQAGSYRRRGDADRMKASLALKGMSSVIQKVSIQGRGDFFRVRVGPYDGYANMKAADEILAQAGIKALRLKISRGG